MPTASNERMEPEYGIAYTVEDTNTYTNSSRRSCDCVCRHSERDFTGLPVKPEPELH